MEQEFEKLEAATIEEELAAEHADARTICVEVFERKATVSRTTLPVHYSRKRMFIYPPTICNCFVSARHRKLCEDIVQTQEIIPRHWKIIQAYR